MISVEDFLFYVDAAIDSMIGIVTGLGDDLANERPDIEGANSPYAILNHCLGVMNFWAGYVVCGRQVDRDRAAEFTASGPVEELVVRARDAQARFRGDISDLEPYAAPRGALGPANGHPKNTTQGGALFHVYEELSQHLGQMEALRDLIVARAVASDASR
jgi:hypothetical protein